MSIQDTTDQNYWSNLLDNAFGAEQSSEPAKEPATQEDIPVEESATCPEPSTAEASRPRKRHLWPVIAAAAAILILLATILLFPRKTVPPELQLCKDALAQWQGYENYRIMVQHSQYGDTMVEPGFEVYLGYGDDLIEYRYSSGDAAVQTLSGIMRKDGQYYQFFMEGSLAQESAVLWQATTAYEGFRAPWPMQFEWNIEKILHHQAQYYDSGALKTVQLTINETNANGSFSSYSPFTAYFNFLQTGTLETVTLHLVKRSNGRYETAGLRVITYMITDYNTEQIKEEFQINSATNSNP